MPLPDDLETLKAALLAEHAVRREAEARASGAEAMVAHLKPLIAKLKRERFGPWSEHRRRLLDQLELQLEELEAVRDARAQAMDAALSRLSPDTTDEQRERVRQLAGELYNLGEQQKASARSAWRTGGGSAREPSLGLEFGQMMESPADWAGVKTNVVEPSYSFKQHQAEADAFYKTLNDITSKITEAKPK